MNAMQERTGGNVICTRLVEVHTDELASDVPTLCLGTPHPSLPEVHVRSLRRAAILLGAEFGLV